MSTYNSSKTTEKIEISTRLTNAFNLDNGFTMVENSILDLLKPMAQTPSAFLVLMTIIRLTIGWGKLSANISYETLKVSSGIASDATISKAIQYWEWLGVIEIKRYACRGIPNRYSINTDFEVYVTEYKPVADEPRPQVSHQTPQIEPQTPQINYWAYFEQVEFLPEIEPVPVVAILPQRIEPEPQPIEPESLAISQSTKNEDYSSNFEVLKKNPFKDSIDTPIEIENSVVLTENYTQITKALQQKITHPTISGFLADCKPIAMERGVLIVAVADDVAADWLNGRGNRMVMQALKAIDPSISVHFVAIAHTFE